MLTLPKDTARMSWTRHIKNKMVFYHLSGAQILRIFTRPDRREEGIAPGTVAAMKTKKSTSTKNPRKEEIWIMYKTKKPKVTMISAWRYPGETKKGERPEIPEDVLRELENIV
jgi:hypothetical protein